MLFLDLYYTRWAPYFVILLQRFVNYSLKPFKIQHPSPSLQVMANNHKYAYVTLSVSTGYKNLACITLLAHRKSETQKQQAYLSQ